MNPLGHSIVGGPPSLPELGTPRWLDEKTLEIPLLLEPGHLYQLSLNGGGFAHFKTLAGRSIAPFPIRFHTAPAGKPMPQDEAAGVIDAAQSAVLTRYSYRDRRGIDWAARFEGARPALLAAENAAQLAAMLATLLAPTNDSHINIRQGEAMWPAVFLQTPPNGTFADLAGSFAWTQFGRQGYATRLDGGLAYVIVGSWVVDQVDHEGLRRWIAEQKGVTGWIIDVRFNGGGDETVARQLAGMYVDEPVVYAKHRFLAEDGFGPIQSRALQPTRPRANAAPAVVLIGPSTHSSCEAFVLMMQAAGATTIGAPTGGGSGNPQPHDLGAGITLLLPSWQAMTVDGQVFEGTGIPPDVRVEYERGPQGQDPVLLEAIRRLREAPDD